MSTDTTAPDFSCEQDMCLEEPQNFEDVQDCDVSLDLLRMVKQEEKQIMPHEKEAIENIALEEGKELKIGTLITEDTRHGLVELLREFKNIFAWSYQDMPGLSTDIVVHRLLIRQDCKPVQQKLRRIWPDIAANIVPIPKKDGKVRMCVDYRDLNKASPKDNFPLPHINTLVDNTAGYSLFSFMDGFSGYNQIKMHPEDMDKTTFITLWGTFCYKVMPFGLKNAGATYQRAMVNLFHDMMHKDIEVYVDDMIAKSHTENEHIELLRRLFLRLRKFQLKLNPAKAIREFPPPRAQKEVRGFLGRLNYIARFISQLTEKCNPIFRLLRKHNQEFDIVYISQKDIKRSAVADFLASRALEDYEPLNFDFPNEELMCIAMTEDSPWRLNFDGASNAVGNGIGAVLVSLKGDHYPFTCKLDFDCTNNMAEYEACIMGLQAAIERGIKTLEVYGDSALVIYQLRGEWETRDSKLINYRKVFLGLLEKFDDITFNYLLRDENQMADALATLASMIKANKEEEATENDKRALRRLACDYVMDGDILYKKRKDQVLLRCVDAVEAKLILEEVHEGVCGTHANGFTMARQIMRFGYYWATMEGDKAASYENVTKSVVSRFLKKEIIFRYGMPEKIISDNALNLNNKMIAEVCDQFKIKHHNSSPYRPKMNGAVEAANKNIKKIVGKMTETYRVWHEKLPFVLLTYRTFVKTSTGATLFSLVYGMEAVLLIEVEIPSLQILTEVKLDEAEWVQSRYDQLNLIEEKRLRAIRHGQMYQKRMMRAYDKKV
ncbi:hypothetical protein CXB51_036174 [Gossypium anomalum]|uniref:Uncharacterized protein n=1 Tax=Gossypium anomalum TaxID=47600 RepID=A0A8J5Y1L8_9ROSI|nr:hypothetical protein CXB51_036174 [Gossypium anomalum]